MDVVVIGGGIIGLSVAHRLAARGMKVAVWDKSRTGTESSWAGAGMLAPGGEIEQRTWWGDLSLRSLGLYAQFVGQLEEESGLSIDFRRCGALSIAGSEEEWESLQALAGRQRGWGIPSELAGARRLFYPDDSAVNPRDLVRALHVACVRLAVQFREECTVTEVVAQGGTIVRPEPARFAILAAGAWTSSIPVTVNGERLPLSPAFPVRGHLIAFEPGKHTPGPILRRGHTYLLDRTSGLTIAGSSTEQVGFLREPDLAHFADIERRARELMPDLNARARHSQWIGFRPGSASGEPEIGRLTGTPLFQAYGHYRNGILLAPATAERIAEEIISAS